MTQFPQDFLWGAATSSHQVEGDNTKNDWWAWEKSSALKEVSGSACRHYQLYNQDFDLAKGLNHNAHRLSLEWSRIEPEEGKFSSAELEHYADVLLSLRQRNLKPIVTLHHFTNPLWLARLGGWQNPKCAGYYLRFVNKVVERFKEQAVYWVTINEPSVYIYYSYIIGAWPPQAKSVFKAMRVEQNLSLAHIQAYRLIHRIYKENKLKPPLVSLAQNLQAFVPCSRNLKNRFSVYLRERLFNLRFIEKLIRNKSLDFIGVNYYSRTLVEVKRWGFWNLLLDVCQDNHRPLKKNSLGWDIYPQGLYELLLKLKKHNLPILILENGICTEDDGLRWDFIRLHLESLQRAIHAGVNIKGYIYWSLIDNYEWDKGFGPRFGLVEVDYSTYQRRVRESAKHFAAVCKTGRLD